LNQAGGTHELVAHLLGEERHIALRLRRLRRLLVGDKPDRSDITRAAAISSTATRRPARDEAVRRRSAASDAQATSHAMLNGMKDSDRRRSSRVT